MAKSPEMIQSEKQRPLWPRLATALGAVALLGVLIWTYSSPIAALVRCWWREPDYAYGFLVPVFAIVLLWIRRDMIKGQSLRGSRWGLLFFGICAAFRWGSAYFFYTLMEPFSLLPCLVGVVLLVGGWQMLRWGWPAIVFLVFMIPLPGFAADMLGHPLQRGATMAATYTIQTLGIPAVAEGNVILLPDTKIGVVEACSGLRMMMLFFAVCVGAALMMRRSAVEKCIIILSAAPIAIIANITRITVTAVLHETAGHQLAEMVFHGLAGWLMMPLAVLLLWAELRILEIVLLEPPPEGQVSVDLLRQ